MAKSTTQANQSPTAIQGLITAERERKEGVYRALIQASLDGFLSTDFSGRILDVNEALCQMLGYTREELLRMHIPDIEASEAHEETAAHIQKIIRTGSDRFQTRHRRKDGAVINVEVSTQYVAELGDRFFAFIRDKIASKQAEEALLKAGALQSAIFNSENFSSIATDAKGVIQIFNVGAERMLGYTAADVMNKITPADISDPQEVIARAKALSVELGTPITPGFDALVFKASRGIEDIYELTYIRKNGSHFPAVVSVTALRDDQNAIIGYLLIGTDNTARKQAIELEYANRMKSEFLANMSHELRTPLNSIIGFTEFLIDEKPGPLRPKQKEYLGDVLNSARHLLHLINDVLDLAKVEAGKMELHLETFLVRKAIEEVTSVIKGVANKKCIAVVIEVSDGLDAVTLDQNKFKQVLYNLLSNAVKFTNEGGQVDIHARCLDPHRIEVQVRDTGIGIKAEDINRLFTAFEQLDTGTSRRFEGTGLGLALTKNIVEFQGGRIDVQSELGRGSVFTVVLPVMIKKETA